MSSICTAYPKLTTWIESKKARWITAGLCHGLSRICPEWRLRAHKHAGISESSHYADNNIAGRKNTFLGAVLKLKVHSIDMFARRADLFEEGIEDTWRNQSNTARYNKNLLRAERNAQQSQNRRSNDSSRPFISHNPYHVLSALDENMLGISSENTNLTVAGNSSSSSSTRGGSQTPSRGLMLPPPRPSPANFQKRKRGSSQSSEVSGVAHSQYVTSPSPIPLDDLLLPGEDPILKARIAKLKRLKTAYEQETD